MPFPKKLCRAQRGETGTERNEESKLAIEEMHLHKQTGSGGGDMALSFAWISTTKLHKLKKKKTHTHKGVGRGTNFRKHTRQYENSVSLFPSPHNLLGKKNRMESIFNKNSHLKPQLVGMFPELHFQTSRTPPHIACKAMEAREKEKKPGYREGSAKIYLYI